MNRLYVFTRQDLPPGYQAVQSCHAVAQMGKRDLRGWDGHIILLSVRDLDALESKHETLFANRPKAFYEPDLDHEMTAFAVMLNEFMQAAFKNEDLALKMQTSLKGWLKGKLRRRYS